MIYNLQYNLEYVPFLLIGFLLISEEKLNHKIISSVLQMIIALFVIIIFVVCSEKLEMRKNISIVIGVILWILLVYIKRCYLCNAYQVNI